MCERWKKEKVAKQTDVEAEIATLGCQMEANGNEMITEREMRNE